MLYVNRAVSITCRACLLPKCIHANLIRRADDTQHTQRERENKNRKAERKWGQMTVEGVERWLFCCGLLNMAAHQSSLSPVCLTKKKGVSSPSHPLHILKPREPGIKTRATEKLKSGSRWRMRHVTFSRWKLGRCGGKWQMTSALGLKKPKAQIQSKQGVDFIYNTAGHNHNTAR